MASDNWNSQTVRGSLGVGAVGPWSREISSLRSGSTLMIDDDELLTLPVGSSNDDEQAPPRTDWPLRLQFGYGLGPEREKICGRDRDSVSSLDDHLLTCIFVCALDGERAVQAAAAADRAQMPAPRPRARDGRALSGEATHAVG